jgi:teichuronic acid biosynthesis glycosyltransferase TuaG
MDGPLVSVIVGVYNKERFVGECLRSVLAQTYSNWELIVVDDASTDGSLAEVERAVDGDSRVRILRRKENSGHPGVARNQAVGEAKGQYVAFLDADDRWHDDKLERQVTFMEEHPEYPFTHTRCMVIGAQSQPMGLRHGGQYPANGDCLDALLGHCFICTSSVMMRMDALKQVGEFSEEPCFKSGQDYEFFVRCAKAFPVAMPEETLVDYRWFDGSVSRNPKNWKSMPTDFVRHVLFLHRPELWKGRIAKSRMRDIVFRSAEENAYAARRERRWQDAEWFAWQMIRFKLLDGRGWRQLLASSLRRK